MDFTNALTVFVNGGRSEALFILFPSGLLSLFLGVLALKYLNGGYSFGLGVTLCLIGLIFLVYGYTALGKYENWHSMTLEAYAADSHTAIASELDRMNKYNGYTKQNFIGAGVVTLVALVLIFIVKVGWLSGIGTGLIYISFIALMIEGGFSASRAEVYTKFLTEKVTASSEIRP